MVKFADYIVRNGEQVTRSNACLEFFVWKVENDHIQDPDKIIFSREVLAKLFSSQTTDQPVEDKRTMCIRDEPKSASHNLFYVLNLHEMALMNWDSNMPDVRKEVYFRQLSVLLCTDHTGINRLFKLDSERFDRKLAVGLPNLSRFLSECEKALKVAHSL